MWLVLDMAKQLNLFENEQSVVCSDVRCKNFHLLSSLFFFRPQKVTAFINLKGLDFSKLASSVSFTSTNEGNPVGKFGLLWSRNELL
jgi:hypothetical protein